MMSKGWIVILYKIKAHCGNAELAKGQIKFRDLKGNAYADIWAGKGAEINEVPWAKKSIVGMIDATAWLVQNRIIAVCTLFLEKWMGKKKAPLPRIRNDPIAVLESLGHIPSEHIRPKWCKCTLCGITWHTRNSMKVAALGKCAPHRVTIDEWVKNTPKSEWQSMEQPPFSFNGAVVHLTHCIRWKRGVIYCIKCGCYSITVMKGLSLPCAVKSKGRGALNTSAKFRLRKFMEGSFPIARQGWPEPEDAICPAFITPHLQEGDVE